MTQETKDKVEEVFKNPKSMTELQYDLKIKSFFVGEVKCYPASVVIDTIATLRHEWKKYAMVEYKRGLTNGKNWWKFWRKK
mgnify:FL=1